MCIEHTGESIISSHMLKSVLPCVCSSNETNLHLRRSTYLHQWYGRGRMHKWKVSVNFPTPCLGQARNQNIKKTIHAICTLCTPNLHFSNFYNNIKLAQVPRGWHYFVSDRRPTIPPRQRALYYVVRDRNFTSSRNQTKSLKDWARSHIRQLTWRGVPWQFLGGLIFDPKG